MYLYGSVLGIIQGLTEFLPISSSGHLFVAQYLSNKFVSAQHFMPFNSEHMPLLYVVLLHVATLCAVLLFTRALIKRSIGACVQYGINTVLKKTHQKETLAYVRLSCMVGVSTVATLPIGLLLKSTVVNASLGLVMTGFLITAILLCVPLLLPRQKTIASPTSTQSNTDIRVSLHQAVFIGLIQGCAVLPGISRSGSTIIAGVLLGLSFAHATYFSFMLAIPTIVLSFISSVLEASLATAPSFPLGFTLVSMVSAFFAGLLGLACIVVLAQKKKLWLFSLYLLSLNLGLLLVSHM